jgi:hypothetical protein
MSSDSGLLFRIWRYCLERVPILDTIATRVRDGILKVQTLYQRYCQPAVTAWNAYVARKQAEAKARREKEAALQAEVQRQAAERKAAAALLEALKPRDTDGAIEDMRLAHSYLDDWMTKKGDHVLGFAAKYIELARTKDPDARLSVELTSGERRGEMATYSQDELAATALFYESQIHSFKDAPRDRLLKAAELLKRALSYNPHSVQLRRHLAEVYLNLHDKQSALAVAEEAMTVNSKNLDARKLHDFVESAPVTQAPGIMQTDPGCVIALVLIGLIIVAFFLLINGEFSAALGTVVIAVIAGFILSAFEGKAMLNKAIDEQTRKNTDGR